MVLNTYTGISNDGAALYLGGSKNLSVPDLNGYEWKSQFSVSIWFKPEVRSYSYGDTKIQGLINNDPNNHASWGIQILQEAEHNNTIQAFLATSNSNKTWDKITTIALYHWHHLVMTYDGKTVKFYHNSHLKLTDSECCHGNIARRNNDLVIGYTKHEDKYDYYRNADCYFKGYIDETKLFKKALTAHEVLKLYRLEVV